MEDLNSDDSIFLQEQIEILEGRIAQANTDRDYFKNRYTMLTTALTASKLGALKYNDFGEVKVDQGFAEETIDRLIELIVKGRHIEILEEAAKKDENVKTAWRNLAIFLKLSDGNEASSG